MLLKETSYMIKKISNKLWCIDSRQFPTWSYKDLLIHDIFDSINNRDIITTGNLACSMQYHYPNHKSRFGLQGDIPEVKRKKLEHFGVMIEDIDNGWDQMDNILIDSFKEHFLCIADFDAVVTPGVWGSLYLSVKNIHHNTIWAPYVNDRSEELFELTGINFEPMASAVLDQPLPEGDVLWFTGGAICFD